MIDALQEMDAKKLNHHDAHCPRCRRATPIPRQRMEMFMPNWQEALKQFEAEMKEHPQHEAPLPTPAPAPAPQAESKPAPAPAEEKPVVKKESAKKATTSPASKEKTTAAEKPKTRAAAKSSLDGKKAPKKSK
jgi:hypothetical protein